MAPLHHRPEITNMRSAYEPKPASHRTFASDSDSVDSYPESHSGSDRSYQTQPTDCSSSSHAKRQHPVQPSYTNTCSHDRSAPKPFFDDRPPLESPRGSVDTYASTVPSEEDLEEEEPERDIHPQASIDAYSPSAIPANPSEFSELFPSRRRLTIRHDDSTLDGNMNLRVDTEISVRRQKREMTLFHMRLQDLRSREFSLRRYCRDSGREVCHSVTKQQKSGVEKRPGFQRSISNALNSMRSKSDQKTPTLGRNDSGYGSMHGTDMDEEQRPQSSAPTAKPQQPSSVKLEFSNYAQVEIKRTGVKGNKRYEFEYWGTTYAWRRAVHKDAASKQVAYHLTRTSTDAVLASITPLTQTASQAADEARKGGWIPPCTLQIADEALIRSQKDVSDVVVASGLTALVDDCIRSRFHAPDARHMLIPMPKMPMGVEYVGPKRLINEMFGRRDSNSTTSNTTTPSSPHPSRPSTARQNSNPARPSPARPPSTSSQRPSASRRQSCSPAVTAAATGTTRPKPPPVVRQASCAY